MVTGKKTFCIQSLRSQGVSVSKKASIEPTENIPVSIKTTEIESVFRWLWLVASSVTVVSFDDRNACFTRQCRILIV